MLSNAIISSPRLGNLFPSWFALKVRGKSWPHPWTPKRVSLCSRSKLIRSCNNTETSSPHPQGYLCTVRPSIWSIWLLDHLYLMGQYTIAIFRKTRKSSSISKRCYKKGTFDQVPHLVVAQLYLYKRNIGHGDSAFVIGYWIKSSSGTNTRSH